MESLYSFIILMFAAAFLVGIAQKIQIPYPLALVVGGVAIGFIPGLHPIYFDPNLLLTVVLPPVLYAASFEISFREFKQNWKEIFSLSLGLVFISTLVLGSLFKWIFPEFPWALSFAFGAIISPPDAIAANAILKRFPMNSRLLTVLQGESLVNDASALVLYKLAVIALLSGVFSLNDAAFEFVKMAVGGTLIGLVFGYIIQTFSRRYLDPVVGVVLSVTIPYVTYILSDALGVSGVLAVVANGLVGAQTIPSHRAPLRRILGFVIWDIYTILLNCIVFILIGLQLKIFVNDMTSFKMLLYVGYGALFALTLVVVRMLWVYAKGAVAYFSASQDEDTEILKESAIIGWAGMRGIVSLTAAMALPFTFPNGMVLEGREEVIFITFVVILLTLLIPALTLPYLIRRLNLKHLSDHHQEHLARKELAKTAEEKIAKLDPTSALSRENIHFLSSYFKMQRYVLEISTSSLIKFQNLESLRLEVIQCQRERLLELWERHEINDRQLSQLEHELDLEETTLARAELK